jgi:hypothetical protein
VILRLGGEWWENNCCLARRCVGPAAITCSSLGGTASAWKERCPRRQLKRVACRSTSNLQPHCIKPDLQRLRGLPFATNAKCVCHCEPRRYLWKHPIPGQDSPLWVADPTICVKIVQTTAIESRLARRRPVHLYPEFVIRYDCIQYGHMIDGDDVSPHIPPDGRVIFSHESSCCPRLTPKGHAYHRQM